MLGLGLALLAGVAGLAALTAADGTAGKRPADKVHPKEKAPDTPDSHNHLFQLPNPKWMLPFRDEQPISFVNRNQNRAEWDSLKAFWNPVVEKAVDPLGNEVTRRAVKIKVPLGLNANPPVPAENPMTVARWRLGKRLYFDPILGSDGLMSCASCHDPKRGYTDQSMVSTGIGGARGGVSAPTVFNSGYHQLQFWDGRANSLEEQAQGPVQNPIEMFNGKGDAWARAVERLRADDGYVREFKLAFGTLPTRDAAAKAVATYERTVLSGNSIHDRAELAMNRRVEAEGTGKLVLRAKDYAAALAEAFDNNDAAALRALQLDPGRDRGKVDAVSKALARGRNLFFGKARCNACHVGENFTDNSFHNLGVGVKGGRVPKGGEGRYASQPVGHKNPAFYGAFKTPTLRHLLGTAPYMHDGSEKTLEQVVDFYDRGGNANAYLDVRMRDEDAERAYLKAAAAGGLPRGEGVTVFDGRPVVPLKLKLTAAEKKDLVLFLRALQGDPADPLVADRGVMPK